MMRNNLTTATPASPALQSATAQNRDPRKARPQAMTERCLCRSLFGCPFMRRSHAQGRDSEANTSAEGSKVQARAEHLTSHPGNQPDPITELVPRS